MAWVNGVSVVFFLPLDAVVAVAVVVFAAAEIGVDGRRGSAGRPPSVRNLYPSHSDSPSNSINFCCNLYWWIFG